LIYAPYRSPDLRRAAARSQQTEDRWSRHAALLCDP